MLVSIKGSLELQSYPFDKIRRHSHGYHGRKRPNHSEQIKAAFEIITADPAVKAILVNIFGGIMKCDIIAQGIIEASRSLSLDIPVVVRLEGTNVELGKKLLEESGLELISANDLDDAAKKAVAAI